MEDNTIHINFIRRQLNFSENYKYLKKMKQLINIYLTIGKKDIMFSYDTNGMLEYVTDVETKKKLMMETVQEGVGYEIHENHGAFIKAEVCDARYVRIMELDYFVPKYLFIENGKDNKKD